MQIPILTIEEKGEDYKDTRTEKEKKDSDTGVKVTYLLLLTIGTANIWQTYKIGEPFTSFSSLMSWTSIILGLFLFVNNYHHNVEIWLEEKILSYVEEKKLIVKENEKLNKEKI